MIPMFDTTKEEQKVLLQKAVRGLTDDARLIVLQGKKQYIISL